MPWRNTLARRLTPQLSAALLSLPRGEAARLTEIRVRAGCPVIWVFGGEQRRAGPAIAGEEMDALIAALCERSRYAYEAQLAQGFIALPGGHRAGVCGRAVMEAGRIVRQSAIRCVCIRIARPVPGASESIRRYLFQAGRPARVLLIGPPGCGKTTMLRDAALFFAGQGWQTAAADERGELFAHADAPPLDVMAGADKAQAIRLLVRSMAPEVIITDEIGRPQDAQALLDAVSCGVGVMASAHGASMEDAWRRPALRLLLQRRAFDRVILLGAAGACRAVFDERGQPATEESDGKLGCGGDGAGGHQRDRLSARGWGAAAAGVGAGDAQVSFTPERRHPL